MKQLDKNMCVKKPIEKGKSNYNNFFDITFNNPTAKIKIYLKNNEDKIALYPYKYEFKDKNFYIIKSLKSFIEEIKFDDPMYDMKSEPILFTLLETHKGLKQFQKRIKDYIKENNIKTFILEDEFYNYLGYYHNSDCKAYEQKDKQQYFGPLRMIVNSVDEVYLMFNYNKVITFELIHNSRFTNKFFNNFLKHKMFKMELDKTKDITIVDIFKHISFSIWVYLESLCFYDKDLINELFQKVNKNKMGKIKIIASEKKLVDNEKIINNQKIKNIVCDIKNEIPKFKEGLKNKELREKLINSINLIYEENKRDYFFKNLILIINIKNKEDLFIFKNYIDNLKNKFGIEKNIIEIDKQVLDLFKKLKN